MAGRASRIYNLTFSIKKFADSCMSIQFVEPSCPEASWNMITFILCAREVEGTLLGRESLHAALAGFSCPCRHCDATCGYCKWPLSPVSNFLGCKWR